MRPQCIDRLITSIFAFYPGANILVADDSQEKFQRNDVTIFHLPFDSGVSAGRNHLVDQVTTDFMVLMDDDHILCPETRIEKLLRPIHSGDFDIVGARIHENGVHFPWEGLLHMRGSTLTLAAGNRGVFGGIEKVDFCHNFFAARTETVRKIRWDDTLKLGEHTDFFLRAKQEGARVGLCPSVYADHIHEKPDNYASYRQRAKAYRLDMLKKHGLTEIVNEVFAENSLKLSQ